MTVGTNAIRLLILGLAIAGTAIGQPIFMLTQLPSTLHPNDPIIWVGANGQMLGETIDPSTGIAQCDLYKNGQWTVFSTPGYSCYVYAANKSGQFVGVLQGPTSETGFPYYPFVNLDGAFTPLLPAGPGSAANSNTGWAAAINDSGAVLGDLLVLGLSGGLQSGAWIYSGGQYRMLTSAGTSNSVVYGLNNNGVAVGLATFGSALQADPAVFNPDGTILDLGDLGGTGPFVGGVAYGINASGQITGTANTAAQYPVPTGGTDAVSGAFIYSGKSMQQIQIPGANFSGVGNWINDAGDVLGSYQNEYPASFFLPPDGFFYYHAGVMYRVDNTLIPNLPVGATVATVSFVEGSSQILLGLTLSSQTTEWFLLTPLTNSNGQPAITAVVNGASFAAPISAGSWITVEGGNLSSITRLWNTSDFAGDSLPTQLDGVSVTMNGVAAYPYYISPTQINALAPDGLTAGPVEVQVTNPQGTSNVFAANASGATPAFFLFGTKYVAAEHANGVPIGPAALGGNFTPAQPGETIELYGTGFGPMSPFSSSGQILAAPAPLANNVTVTVGGQPAVVTYAGVVSNGLDQLNVTVPPGLPNGDALVVAATSNGFGPIYETQAGLAITVQQ
ncbi:MAG: IPT/TIG domain-containing protein [Bryobacteraceae bacterium]